MPRDHARLLVSIWADDDWRQLSSSAQRRYTQLLSQERINYAGVQSLHVTRWANSSRDDTEAQVRADLNELHTARFIVVDTSTEEVLIRSFIRGDRVYRMPRVLQSALCSARQVQSPVLRAVLAEELLKLEGLVPETHKIEEAAWPAVKITADALVHPNAKGLANPSGNPLANPSRKGFEAESNQPRSEDAQKPFGKPFPEPFGKPSGVGEGVGVSVVPVTSSPEAGSKRVHARTREAPSLDEVSGSAHTPAAHRLLTSFAKTCRKQPPADVLRKLGPIVDRLIQQDYTPEQIALGLAEWNRKGLGTHLLAEVVHEVVNSDRGRHLRSVDDIPDEELTREFLDRELGPDSRSPACAPREVEDGDPDARRAWYQAAARDRLQERRAEYRRRAKQRTSA